MIAAITVLGTAPGIPAGILLPESTLHSQFFAILAAFVAINTVMYAALAIAKIVPMVHLGDLIPGRRRRAETRSIHPETLPDVGAAGDPSAPVSFPLP